MSVYVDSERVAKLRKIVENCEGCGNEDDVASANFDLGEAIGEENERARCIRLINKARLGEIDADLRAVRAWIEAGDEPKEEGK